MEAAGKRRVLKAGCNSAVLSGRGLALVGQAGKAIAIRHLLACLLCLATGLLGLPAQAEPLVAPEHQVKATWLLNLTLFTEWPAKAFPATNSPFVVGVLGKELNGMDLEKTFGSKPIKGRTVAIKKVSSEREMRECHLLFITSSERRRTRDLLEKLKGEPVLTVGETEQFLDHGGIINLLLNDKTLQLEIDLNAAQKSGLTLNANLLKIAKVRGKYE